MPGYQFRSATFTQFNVEKAPELGNLQYIAFGLETCPSTQRQHWQGFAYSYTKMTHKKWRETFPGAHIEEMKGNFRQNEVYCSKEGTYTEFGIKPMENGKKRSLAEMKEQLDNGEKPVEVATKSDKMFGTFLQYRSGLNEYAQYIREKKLKLNRDVPDVYVRIGPSGTGKTRWLDDTFGLDGWTFAPDNTGHWFDGCDCDVICFDEVEAGAIPSLSTWKILCDRYGKRVPVKGGFIYWKPKVIVFTSNQPISKWWPNLTEFDLIAIERRCKEIVVVE
ncbi:replication-associated protein [Ctenophore-associated circular virus 3]|uniref:replication-associated protein n=1 Tax=Ctenophore-associated circular virus 3 TaxID=1778560 RepID=UPI000764CEB7|nr:replication-associated protein [Ctenophore-associated circular virus 3]ALY05860.1 replication-associated protein [Ctenophore-associated circular virus 3]